MIAKRYGLTKSGLKERAGTIKQFCGIEKVQYLDGKAKNVEALFFRTGSGLTFTVLPDRCMDIFYAEMNGTPLAYLTQAGICAPQYYDNKSWAWVKTFGGGLLTTCGLMNVGPACEFEGDNFGAHGAISAAPAQNICIAEYWDGENFILEAKGTMREERMNKYNLKMERTIRAVAGSKQISIQDKITNEAHKSSPLMIMYHMNMGFPLVSENSRLATSLKSLLPRDPDAADGVDKYSSYEKPKDKYFEKCYFHIMNKTKNGKAAAGIFNPKFENGIGIVIEWDRENLPRMTQWKMLGKGLYVNGIEPSNCWCNSVPNEVNSPEYRPIEPGEERIFNLTVSVLNSKEEIKNAEQKIKSLAAGKIEILEPIIKERSKSI